MPRILVVRGGVTLLALVALSCATPAAPAPNRAQSVETSAPPSATSPLQGAALVLDVRNADEYAQGHVDNATLIPVAELEQRLAEVETAVGGDKTKKIVVYCGTGRRAAKALELLQRHGYTQVVNAGGYKDLR